MAVRHHERRTTKASALLKGAKDIRVALVASGSNIVTRLTDQYPPPEVDGVPLFDYGRVEHLVHELETAEASVVAAEDAHMKQEVRLSRLRTERPSVARLSSPRGLVPFLGEAIPHRCQAEERRIQGVTAGLRFVTSRSRITIFNRREIMKVKTHIKAGPENAGIMSAEAGT